MNLIELRTKIEQQKGKKEEVQSSIKGLRRKLTKEKRHLQNLEKASSIIRIVGLETQQQLQFHISDITSLAMEGIFPDPYKVQLEFVEKRGKTECDILFDRNGNQVKPLDAVGGGAVDVASFALRIASWSMAMRKTRNVILLDEPMRFLSSAYQENASEMIKEVSQKLGIQFVIVSHNQILTENADKVFEVSIKKGITKVK
jgi:chromosome segregation ATPase